MKDKTQIILNLRFKKNDGINIYRMLNYYDRDDRCCKFNAEINDMLNYYEYRLGSTGCFGKNGIYNRDNVERDILKYKPSCYYQMVISFRPEFAIENDLVDLKDMQAFITKTMNRNIIELGLEPDNVVWGGYYHTNTENPHVHIWMYEKTPTKKILKINKKRFTKMKSVLGSYLVDSAELLSTKDIAFKNFLNALEKCNIDKKVLKSIKHHSFSKFFPQDKLSKDLYPLLRNLYNELPAHGSLKYNSANILPYKNDINEIIKIIKEDNEISQIIQEYQSHVEKVIDKNVFLYGGNKYDNKYQHYRDNQLKKIDDRIGNLLLQTIKQARTVDQQTKSKKGLSKKECQAFSNFLCSSAFHDITYDIAVLSYSAHRLEQEAESAREYAIHDNIEI